MVPIHVYFVTQNVMFPITFLHLIARKHSFFFCVSQESGALEIFII